MRRLLLIGGGHGHLGVLRSLAARPLAGVETVLVSPEPVATYSGMVPGYLQDRYALADLTIDLAGLARAAGVRFVQAGMSEMDPWTRRLCIDGEGVSFDGVSLDLGSVPAGLDVPGVADHAHTLRPLGRIVALRRRLDELAAPNASARIHVVGGGAAGVEVAFAIRQYLGRRGQAAQLSLHEAGERLLAGFDPIAGRLATDLLAQADVTVQCGRRVASIARETLTLADGTSLLADMVIWATGAAAPAVLHRTGLPLDQQGYFLVDETLRAVNGAPVWGIGDCITLAGHPALPKAGVFAVREAPILVHNLRAWASGGSPRPYLPQTRYLALLNTADGRAILHRSAWVRHARWAWWLKDWIDRRYVSGYQRLANRFTQAP